MKKECLFWLTVTVASVHYDVILLLWAFYNREHPGRKMRQRKKHIQHLKTKRDAGSEYPHPRFQMT